MLGTSEMTSQLPPNLARLFMPRPPLKFLPSGYNDSSNRPRVRLTGLSNYINLFGEREDESPPTVDEVKKLSKKVCLIPCLRCVP